MVLGLEKIFSLVLKFNMFPIGEKYISYIINLAKEIIYNMYWRSGKLKEVDLKFPSRKAKEFSG